MNDARAIYDAFTLVIYYKILTLNIGRIGSRMFNTPRSFTLVNLFYCRRAY